MMRNLWTIMVVSALLVGCQGNSAWFSPDPMPYTSPGFATDVPVEVAVLPIVGYDRIDAAAAKALRDGLYDQLISKGYAPLSLEYVDRMVSSLYATGATEVSFERARGMVDADSILIVHVPGLDVLPRGERGFRAVAELYERDQGILLFSAARSEAFLPPEPHRVGDPLGLGRRLAGRLLTDLPSRRATEILRRN